MSKDLAQNVPDRSIQANICVLSGEVEAARAVLRLERDLLDVG